MVNQSKTNRQGGNSGEAAAETKAERRRHELIKAEVFDFEKKNRSKLVAFKSTGAWWKFGGTSALLYAKHVAPRIGKDPQIRPDRDFFSKFAEGVVSIKDIDTLTRDLKGIGIKLVEDGKERKIFELGQKFSEEDIELMRNEDKLAKEQLNQLILPKVMYPNLFAHLRALNEIARVKQRGASQTDRTYIMDDFAGKTREMVEKYIRMAMGFTEANTALAAIRDDLVTVRVYLAIIDELKIMDVRACLRFAGKLIETQTLVDEAINNGSAGKDKK